MEICPNCHKHIQNDSLRCPYCHTKLTKENIEMLENLPITKEENQSNTITHLEQLEKTIKLKVKDIPLIIKKPIQKDNHKEKNNNININNLVTNLELIATILILVVTIIGLSRPRVIYATLDNHSSINSSVPMLGYWISEKSSLFEFNEENEFYWYENYQDKKNNYYKGEYTYKTGLEALQEMGYDEKEFAFYFPNIEIEDAYSVKVKLEESVINKNLSPEKNQEWWIIFIKNSKDTAICYNKTLDKRYNLIKE